MDTRTPNVEPYRYFWLHTQMPKQADELSHRSRWTVPHDNFAWIDGDHYIGTLRDYCIGINNDVLVIVEPLFQIESDDGKLKWHRINDAQQSQSVMHFNDCVLLGDMGKLRVRFKSGDDLFILSSDPSDAIIFDVLSGILDLNEI